jgi:hypothetical protein
MATRERIPLIDKTREKKAQESGESVPAVVRFKGHTVRLEKKTPFMPIFLALASLGHKEVDSILRAFGVQIFDTDGKVVWE